MSASSKNHRKFILRFAKKDRKKEKKKKRKEKRKKENETKNGKSHTFWRFFVYHLFTMKAEDENETFFTDNRCFHLHRKTNQS